MAIQIIVSSEQAFIYTKNGTSFTKTATIVFSGTKLTVEFDSDNRNYYKILSGIYEGAAIKTTDTKSQQTSEAKDKRKGNVKSLYVTSKKGAKVFKAVGDSITTTSYNPLLEGTEISLYESTLFNSSHYIIDKVGTNVSLNGFYVLKIDVGERKSNKTESSKKTDSKKSTESSKKTTDTKVKNTTPPEQPSDISGLTQKPNSTKATQQITTQDMSDVAHNNLFLEDRQIASDPLFYKNIAKFFNSYGSPFLYLQETDPCYYNRNEAGSGVPLVGRASLSTVYSNPAIFSICPGKPVYLPNITRSGKQSLLNAVLNAVGNELEDKVQSLNQDTEEVLGQGPLAEKLYEFQCDYNDYINRLNTLARVCAIMYGIGDKQIWGTGPKYRNMDYSYFTTGKQYETLSSHASSGADKLKDTFLWQLETGASSTFSDDQYIHFFLSNEGTSYDESHETTTKPSPFHDLLTNGGGLHELSKSINFLFGGAMSDDGLLKDAYGDMDKLLNDIGAQSGDVIKSLTSVMKGYIQGGRMVVPEMIDSVDYSNTVSCVLNFYSLSADPEDAFIRVMLPTLAILTFALPKQLTNNMYGYPYIVKAYQRGKYSTDLAVLGNLRIDRGGPENTSWTQEGIPTNIQVSFDLVPLHSSLMGGNGRNPFLFMDNSALLEYLGNMCGIDLNINNLSLKSELYKALLTNTITDTSSTLGRRISTKLKNKLEGFFKFN